MTSRKHSRFALACLLLMSAVIVTERLHTFDEPLDRDISGYAVIGHEMLAGRKLYSDLWERKPPLLFISFAAAERLVGYGPGEVFLLNVVCAVGTLLAVYFAGGIFAAALWMIFNGDMWMQGNQPNAEAFVNLFLAWGFAVLLCDSDRQRRWRGIAVGVMFAAATFYKHHVVVICMALLMANVISKPRKIAVADAAMAMLFIAGTWAALLGYFKVVGRFDAMYSALFRQNAAYAGGLFSNVVHSFWLKNLFPQAMRWSLVPILLIVLWVVAGARKSPLHTIVLIIAYFTSAWIVVALPGYFFGHYYQLLLPPLCIAGGCSARGLTCRDAKFSASLRWGAIGLVFSTAACWEAAAYRLSAEDWAREKESTDDLPGQQAMALELNQLLKPGEQFWELGDDNILYFASHRSPPSGLLYPEPFATGPERRVYAARLLRDLQSTRPRLIIVDQRWEKSILPESGFYEWMAREYQPYPGDLNRYTFRVYARK